MAVKHVLQYSISGDFIKEWDSASQIEKELKFDAHCIRGCCRGLYKTSNNYIWHYKDSNEIELKLPKEELITR